MYRYRALTFAKCTTVLSAVLTVTSGLGSSFDKIRGNGIGSDMVWIEMIFGVALRSFVIYSNPFVDHTLW
jgi:hypothetical protein